VIRIPAAGPELLRMMDGQLIGEALRGKREALGLTLEQAAGSTHIRLHYLQALEADDFASLPSPAQARGFLRAYAGLLKLDPEPLLAELNGPTAAPTIPAPISRPRRAPGPSTPREPSRPRVSAPLPPPVPGGYAGAYPPAADPVSPEAKAIFIEIGRRLRSQRELLGLSIEDVERHTHLRQHYLRALETGDLARLPSPVQGRGMLNNYAVFLGMDVEPLLLRFAEGLQTRLAAVQAAKTGPRPKEPSRPAPPPPGLAGAAQGEAAKAPRKWFALRLPTRPVFPGLPSPLRRILSADVLIGAGLVIFLVGFGLWGAVRIFSLGSNSAATPSAPSVAEVLLATGTPTPTPTRNPRTPLAAPTDQAAAADDSGADATALPPPETANPFPVGVQGADAPTAASPNAAASPRPGSGSLAAGNVQVYVTILQRAYLRVLVDGKEQFNGRALPGSAYPFTGDKQIELHTGNAAGVQVFFNGQDLGALGQFGQVAARIFTARGIITPTSTVAPNPSPTPKATPTVAGAIPVPTGAPPNIP
jgi:transcriptional regulator with XRE-family HTH domain